MRFSEKIVVCLCIIATMTVMSRPPPAAALPPAQAAPAAVVHIHDEFVPAARPHIRDEFVPEGEPGLLAGATCAIGGSQVADEGTGYDPDEDDGSIWFSWTVGCSAGKTPTGCATCAQIWIVALDGSIATTETISRNYGCAAAGTYTIWLDGLDRFPTGLYVAIAWLSNSADCAPGSLTAADTYHWWFTNGGPAQPE